MATELDGFEYDRTGWAGAGAHAVPVRTVTLHTTEGDGLEGARSTLNKKRAQPHVLTEGRARKGRRRVQMVATDRAAKALKNLPGGTETNRGGTLQVEVVGFAADPAGYTEGDWLWIGEAVVGPLLDEYAIPPVAPYTFHVYPPDRERPPQYLGSEPWRIHDDGDTVRGVIGHQHWIENVHGDPGDLSAKLYRNGTASAIDLIIEGARRYLHLTAPPVTVPGKEPDMPLNAADLLRIADVCGKVLDRRLNPDGKGNLLVRIRDGVAREERRSIETVIAARATVEGVRSIVEAVEDATAGSLGAPPASQLAAALHLVPKPTAADPGDEAPEVGVDLGPATAEAV